MRRHQAVLCSGAAGTRPALIRPALDAHRKLRGAVIAMVEGAVVALGAGVVLVTAPAVCKCTFGRK